MGQSVNQVKSSIKIIFLILVLILLVGCTNSTSEINANKEVIKNLQNELKEKENQLKQLKSKTYSKQIELYSNKVIFDEKMDNIKILYAPYGGTSYIFQEHKQRAEFGYIDIFLNNFFKHSFNLNNFNRIDFINEHEDFIDIVQDMKFHPFHDKNFLSNLEQRPFIHHHLPTYIYVGVKFHKPIQFDNEVFESLYIRDVNHETELLLHSANNEWFVYSSKDVMINEELKSVVILRNLLGELSSAIEVYEELQNK